MTESIPVSTDELLWLRMDILFYFLFDTFFFHFLVFTKNGQEGCCEEFGNWNRVLYCVANTNALLLLRHYTTNKNVFKYRAGWKLETCYRLNKYPSVGWITRKFLSPNSVIFYVYLGPKHHFLSQISDLIKIDINPRLLNVN